MTTASKIFVALDLGNKQTKIKTEKETLVLPSKLINSLDTGRTKFTGGIRQAKRPNELHTYQILNHDDSYEWGADLNQLNLNDQVLETIMIDNRYDSEMFENLANFALARAVKPFVQDSNQKIVLDVVTGMPTADYILSDESETKAIKKVLSGDHSVLIDGETFNLKVENIYVIPQPAGTLYDIMLNANGEIVDANIFKQKVRIIDIGGGTLILNEFDSGELNANIESTSYDGAQSLYRMIKNHSSNKMILQSLEQAFKNRGENNGHIIYHYSDTNVKDITEEVKPEVHHWTQNIINKINTVFGESKSFDRTIFTGGSINLVDREYIKKYVKNAEFVPNGEIANVSGFYKLYLAQLQQEGE